MILGKEISGLRMVVTTLLLLACLCFGGSASVSQYEMGLSIFALVCLLVVIWSGTTPKIGGPIRWFIVAFVLFVAIQLVPLPHGVWSGMPQGQFAESLLPNAQLQGMWKSVSIAPDETIYSLIAAVPALIILWLVVSLSQSERHVIANILVIAVLCQALIGIAQASGALLFSIYDYHHPKVAIGLFASRNHFADLILMGTSIMFSVRQSWSRRYGRAASEIIFHVFWLVFLLAMMGSASRAGLALFALVTVIGYVLILRENYRLFFLATSSIFAAVLWKTLEFLPQTGVVKTTLARFEVTEDGRWEIWKTSWLAAQSYWPWGAGLGGFRQVYEKTEFLQNTNPFFVNAAHNEYLQLLIEAGLLGGILKIGIILTVCALAWRHRRFTLSNFSFLGFIAIILHSAVDYPFRVISINVSIAVMIAYIVSNINASTFAVTTHPLLPT